MEYIERDKVHELIKKMADGYEYLETPVKHLTDKINSVHAADVRPVVRGKWIPHYEDFDDYDGGVEKRQWGFECSICGRWEENAEPFCNCGADMREES